MRLNLFATVSTIISKSMYQQLSLLLIFITFFSCVEPFEFESKNEDQIVVVEGHVSDISADQYYQQFEEVRFFEVKIKYTGEVKNQYDNFISGAEVELISDQNESWDYTESGFIPGTYILYHSDFAAQPNVAYRINVRLPNGETYISKFEQMPSENNRGQMTEKENSIQRLVTRTDEDVIRRFKGLDLNVQLEPNDSEHTNYFRWDCLAVWKLEAYFASVVSPGKLCWISEKFYFDDYSLAIQRGQPINKKLFFLQTSGNQKTKFGFSAIISQQQMTEGHYQFWKDLQNQKAQSELFAPPPYNLYTNIAPEGHDNQAYGYFGVVNEENYIWFYDKNKLSYRPTYIEECNVQFPTEPAEWCSNCLNYGASLVGSNASNIKPVWWTFD